MVILHQVIKLFKLAFHYYNEKKIFFVATFSRGGFSIGSVGAPTLAENFFEKKFPLGPRGLELRAKLCSH